MSDDSSDLLFIRWPDGICLRIQYTWAYFLVIEKDGTSFFCKNYRKEPPPIEDVKQCVKDIQTGNYKRKKTRREQIAEIIRLKGLTSYMNNTKWHEFRQAMLKEMPFIPPYDYKLLFDADDYIHSSFIQHLLLGDTGLEFCSMDEESFNFLDYKSIEWLILRPSFFSLEGGMLVKKKVWHNAENEFVEILKKYSIPYETKNGAYIIYGYKNKSLFF